LESCRLDVARCLRRIGFSRLPEIKAESHEDGVPGSTCTKTAEAAADEIAQEARSGAEDIAKEERADCKEAGLFIASSVLRGERGRFR
jgi:hypothetical protein